MLEKKEEFVVDLRTLNTDGEFHCPKCGALIDPDDSTEEVYGDLEAIMDQSGNLHAIRLRCKKCGSKIKIIGLKDI
jgi:predicted nucleic-acid-binding Zn-ribbon protein